MKSAFSQGKELTERFRGSSSLPAHAPGGEKGTGGGESLTWERCVNGRNVFVFLPTPQPSGILRDWINYSHNAELCNESWSHKGAPLAVCIASGLLDTSAQIMCFITYTDSFSTRKRATQSPRQTHTDRSARHSHAHQRATDGHAVPSSVRKWCISNRVPIRLIDFPCWRMSLPATAGVKVSAINTLTHTHSACTLTQPMVHHIIFESLLLIHWNYSFSCKEHQVNRGPLSVTECLFLALCNVEITWNPAHCDTEALHTTV